VVLLKAAPVAKKNKRFNEKRAIVTEEGRKGWYTVEVQGNFIKWRGKDNMETLVRDVVPFALLVELLV